MIQLYNLYYVSCDGDDKFDDCIKTFMSCYFTFIIDSKVLQFKAMNETYATTLLEALYVLSIVGPSRLFFDTMPPLKSLVNFKYHLFFKYSPFNVTSIDNHVGKVSTLGSGFSILLLVNI